MHTLIVTYKNEAINLPEFVAGFIGKNFDGPVETLVDDPFITFDFETEQEAERAAFKLRSRLWEKDKRFSAVLSVDAVEEEGFCECLECQAAINGFKRPQGSGNPLHAHDVGSMQFRLACGFNLDFKEVQTAWNLCQLRHEPHRVLIEVCRMLLDRCDALRFQQMSN